MGSEFDYFELRIDLRNFTDSDGNYFPKEPQFRRSNIMPQFVSELEAMVIETAKKILEVGL